MYLKNFDPDIYFDFKDILLLKTKQPNLFLANSQIKRNQRSYYEYRSKTLDESKELYQVVICFI